MGASSFSQLYIHLVFSPHLHCPVKTINHQEQIFKFTAGLLNSMGHKSLAVNGMYDHIHIFFGLKPSMSISDVVKEVKRSSTNFIKQEFQYSKFSWQEGYGAFSYSRSHISNVVNYIINQKEHHKKKTFREEYIELLEDFQIEYDLKYLFDFFD
ncbi:MAG: IS200/IS605 family transposase [Bacteroidales bacterium]|nr:IS200/IS605 family transposase [Bacteroidales bacterium]